MPNSRALRNSSQLCHWAIAGRARISANSAGGRVAHEPEPLAEHVVETFDVRVHVGRERRRRGPVGDEQVERRDHREDQEEPDEQGELGADHTPEHVAAAERLVPQEVDVEPGDRAPEDEDEQEHGTDGDEEAATRETTTWTVHREIRRAPHRR